MRPTLPTHPVVSLPALLFVLPGALAIPPIAQAQEPVRAWQGTLDLPTYVEGTPDPNPPFDYFLPPRVNYPYAIRNNLTDERTVRSWRTLVLENEYLRCSVLPDLGGHLYSCTDKVNGEEMFYDNGAIKLSQIGYRGAWAALGVEFNFPVSHNWMSTSPVDFNLVEHADGSASILIGNIDRVYRTDWRVRLTLRPGSAVLEQHTTLYNQSDVRHRYYWWTNAAVRATDRSWILYPQKYSASHGFTDVDTWPVDRRGTDNSLVGNHEFGPVSRFSHGSREGFMAVYHPDSESGVLHYSSPSDLPAKKIWSWGRDARGLDWREALSDDSSAYVEIQAGIFRDQETYGFLDPQSTVRFSAYWTPLRDLGGLSRGNPAAALHMCRTDACGLLPAPGLSARGEGPLRLRLSVTSDAPAATVRIRVGDRIVHDLRMDLTAASTIDTTFADLTGPAPATVAVSDASGRPLIRHTEGLYDLTPDAAVRTGAQASWPPPPKGSRTESDIEAIREDLERNGRRVEAWQTVQEGLARFPGSHVLNRSGGRLAAVLGRYDDAIDRLSPVLARVSNDTESLYYLGVALSRTGRDAEARLRFEGALPDGRFHAAARLELAEIAARSGETGVALRHVRTATADHPGAVRVGFAEVALLRAADREGDALARADHWRAIAPSHNGLRWEATRLGAHDPGLIDHLAADGDRILEIATQYIRLGLLEEAETLLEYDFPAVPDGTTEPGQPHPSSHPVIAYLLGYVRQGLGKDGSEEFRRARGLDAARVFPSRPETGRALEAALAGSPDDGLAASLLGSLALARLDVDKAIAFWQQAASSDPGLSALHRNLGLTLLRSGASPDEAIDVLLEGRRHDARNVGLYEALDEALEAGGRTALERADALLAYPDVAAMPAALMYRTVRRLVEAARFDEADALFYDRYFPREEGGINVREVYLESLIGRAAAAVDEGRCRAATEILDHLLDPSPGLAFTNSGLELWLNRSGLVSRVEELRGACRGQERADRTHR